MTDTEISKLTRKELIEMLLAVTEENDRLKEENEHLKKEQKQRRIAVETSGTMAEAALKLNRVFEAADAAAKQYLQNIKAKADAEKSKEEAAEKAAEKAADKSEAKTADKSEEKAADKDTEKDKDKE